MLESLFGWGKASKCKALVKIVINRVKLLRNKREILIKQLRHDVAQLFIKGQLQSSFSRIELVFKEKNLLHGYDMVEQFCECILKRLSYIRRHKDRPQDIDEALSSLIFAAARCADLPELQRLRSYFVKRYGLEFASSSVELLPGSGVNKQIIEKLSVRSPTCDSKLNLMKEIAREFNLQWDSSIEAELCKPIEDSLTGSRGPEKFKSCQGDVDSVCQPSLHVLDVDVTAHSINDGDGSISENFSTAVKKQEDELSDKQDETLTEHVGPEEKIFERDIPVISSTIKEIFTVPPQNGRTLGVEKQESLPCVISLQSRDKKFTRRSNRDKITKDTSFDSSDVAGVNFDNVCHYVDNNIPSAALAGSAEMAAGATLVTENLAKSSKLSREGNIFECPLVCRIEKEGNISDQKYIHQTGTQLIESKISRRSPSVEDIYGKEDTHFPEWSKEIVDSDSELGPATYFGQSYSQRTFDLNGQMHDLQDFSKAQVNSGNTGRRSSKITIESKRHGGIGVEDGRHRWCSQKPTSVEANCENFIELHERGMINENVEGWNARGKEYHFRDGTQVEVSSRKEHRSEHRYSSRTGKKVRSKSRRRHSLSSHYPIDMNTFYGVNYNDGAESIFPVAKRADPFATVSSRKKNIMRDLYNEQFAKVQDGVNLRRRSIHSTHNQVTPQLYEDKDRSISENGHWMSCDMLDCYIDSDSGDEASIISQNINPEKDSPFPMHVKLHSRKTLGQEQDSFEATRHGTSKVYSKDNDNSGKLRSKEEINDFLISEEKLHERCNYCEQGFYPDEKAYITSSINGESYKLPQLIEKATKSSPQVFSQSQPSFSGTSKKSLCHLDNHGSQMEQQFQQYSNKRESSKPALIKSYGSDKMLYKARQVLGDKPHRERNRSLDLAHKHLHDIDIDTSDMEDQYSQLSDSTANVRKEKHVRNLESFRRDFDGRSYEYRQHRGSNKLLEKTYEELGSEGGDSFHRFPAEKIHTPRASALDIDRGEKAQRQRRMRYYMEENDDELLSGRHEIPEVDLSHRKTKQYAYATKRRERNAVNDLAKDEKMQHSLDVACHIQDVQQPMSRNPPVAPTHVEYVNLSVFTKSVSVNKISDSVMPQKMQFINRNSDVTSTTDSSIANSVTAAARTPSRPPPSPSRPPPSPSTHSTSSSQLLSHTKPSSPASPLMGPPQRPPPKPPCTWERVISLPPERSGASPVRLTVRSNSLQRNASSEFPSYGHSPRTPHVHPKLPDYDDLAAKFTALKQQHRTGIASK